MSFFSSKGRLSNEVFLSFKKVAQIR